MIRIGQRGPIICQPGKEADKVFLIHSIIKKTKSRLPSHAISHLAESTVVSSILLPAFPLYALQVASINVVLLSLRGFFSSTDGDYLPMTEKKRHISGWIGKTTLQKREMVG